MYKNSVLGLVWSMIAPAMTLAIYFVVFQFIAKNGIPNFVIFLFSGLLVWNLFMLAVQTGTGVIVNNAGIVKKVSFPREILALASIGSAGVFFFFQTLVMLIFLVVFHSAPAWNYLPLIPLALVAAMVLAAGLAILLSAVNVYLRDTQHLIEVVLTAWFWACPIVYSFQHQVASKLAAHGVSWLYFLNPITPLVLSFQRGALRARPGDPNRRPARPGGRAAAPRLLLVRRPRCGCAGHRHRRLPHRTDRLRPPRRQLRRGALR